MRIFPVIIDVCVRSVQLVLCKVSCSETILIRYSEPTRNSSELAFEAQTFSIDSSIKDLCLSYGFAGRIWLIELSGELNYGFTLCLHLCGFALMYSVCKWSENGCIGYMVALFSSFTWEILLNSLAWSRRLLRYRRMETMFSANFCVSLRWLFLIFGGEFWCTTLCFIDQLWMENWCFWDGLKCVRTTCLYYPGALNLFDYGMLIGSLHDEARVKNLGLSFCDADRVGC